MDQRHKELLGKFADDADVRGEHKYPDLGTTTAPDRVEEQLIAREGTYVAGANGTQQVTSEAASELSEVECPDDCEG